MSDAARVLEAGGLVTPGSELPSDLPVDTVDARGYRHPALPDRVVVRLVADVIARGVDTEMGLLGFALAEHHDDIALRRRQALGFPGRALLEDPDRARFALDVMKEFKAQAKRIASKPGHAREGFEEIAQKLERTVPQFLPSYWEEVGRAFATAGNLAYAASSFDKARTAEREFGLTVDEGIRGDAFLEFALLGALTVKSLQTYGKELQKTVGAEAAHDRMVSLAVRRTLGGPPPWASMLKDLRGLAKAAKRDVDAEECRLVRELLAGSSMVRAPKSFWQESKASLAHLAAHEPLVRARLLDLFPNGGATRYSWRRDDGFTDEWMELLAEIGVLDVIWDPNTPKDALPAGGRAAWLGRLLEWAPAGNSWILQVVRRSADVLRADGDRVPVHAERAYRPFDLDLLELVIELALPYSTGDGALRVDLDEWAQWQSAPERHGLAAEVRPKDPIRAVAVPALARRLSSAIDAAFGETHFEEVAARMSALRTLRGAWLAERVADLTRSGLGLTASALERLEGVSSASHFAEFPECFEALKAADVARSLHRTLQTGILDELGWDAFDASVDALNPKPDDDEVIQTSQWPHLIWGLAHRLYVLGPSGVELVHDVKLGKDVAPTCVAWVGGELFVGASSWSRGSYQQQAYWSGAAADVFEVEGLSHSRDSSPIEDGDAIVMGAERFTRRDRVAVPDAAFQFHDHERSWVWHEYALHEQDRRTGKPGAKGAPGFLADALHDGPASWSYRVVPEPYAATSPLGTVNGLYGAKVVTPAPVDEDPTLDEDTLDDENETSSETRVETLAGARFVGPIHEGTSQHQPTRLMRWPGTSAWRPIVPERYRWRRHHDHSFRIGDPDLPVVSIVQDDDVRMAARLLPPIEFWHYLRPRDEAGSLALRAVTTDVARALLDAGEDEGAGLPAAIAAGLPSVTNDALRAGVGLVSKLAYELEQRLLTLQEERAGGKVGERSESEIQDSAVTDALDNLRHYWSWGGSYVSAEIRTLGAFLARGEDVEIRESRLEPRDWIGRIRGIAACAVRPGVEDAPRAALIEALRVWRDSGLADPGSFRIGRMRLDALQPWVVTETDDGVTSPVEEFKVELDGRRLWVWDCDTDDEGPWDFDFVEWSADGTFGGLPGAVVSRERTARIDGDREWLDDFFTEVAARGPREVTPEAVAAVAEAIGQSPAEAVVALCTFPKELPKAIREAHGLKATAAKGAASAFGDWSADRKLDLLVAMSPEHPAGLWDSDPTVQDGSIARWIRVWLERVGKVVPIDPELLAAADKELPGRDGGALLRSLGAYASWTELHHDAHWAVDADGDIEGQPDDRPAGFQPDLAEQLCMLIPWVAYRLPVGDPLRANLVPVWNLACERARADSLLVEIGSWYLGEEKSKERKAGDAWFEAVGGELTTSTDDDGDVSCRVRRAGPLVVSHNGWRLQVVARPAGLDPHSRQLAETFARASESASEELAALAALQSDDLRSTIERIQHSPLPVGAWEQDARLSAPDVLAAVGKKLGLDEASALLYLQTLALLDPTKKNVMLWNGWSAKVYAAAAAELVAKRLVVEGKRARAAREHFLPGGWCEEKRILPYEEWKRPLYGWVDEGFPLGIPVALAPVHVTFARAWSRHTSGDAPRFQEVRR